ncbi:MAG: hypothetical protein KUG58_12165 [Marinosulfonomonas sp.]|nr:hypothetical protein [Marinosulfonomonas sp.]
MVGALLITLMTFQGLSGWFGLEWVQMPSVGILLAVIIYTLIKGNKTARVFILIAAFCGILAVALLDSPMPTIWDGLKRALFFQAFLTALFTLQEAALRSKMLHNIGHFLINQPVRRRSFLLVIGTNVMALMMNIGALVMIGSIAKASEATGQTNVKSDSLEKKQLPLAALRGFPPSSVWSPLALPPVFLATFYPDVELSTVMLYGVCVSLLLLLLSFLVISVEVWIAARSQQISEPLHMAPTRFPTQSVSTLAGTLVMIFGSIVFFSSLLDISVAISVILIIPATSVIWLLLMCRFNIKKFVQDPVRNMVCFRLPQTVSETSVIVSAAFMGPILLQILPVEILADYIITNSIAPALFAAVVFFGMIGMAMVGVNSVLSTTIALAVAGDPLAFGLEPIALILVILTAWALASQLTPFSTTAIMVSKMFDVAPAKLVFQWNGLLWALTMLIATGVFIVWGMW